MVMDVKISKDKPSLAGALIAEILASKGQGVKWSLGDANLVKANNEVAFTASASILRFVARSFPGSNLYGLNDLQRAEIDHWLNFAFGRLAGNTSFKVAVDYLDQVLKPVTFVVGNTLSIADMAIWETLHSSSNLQACLADPESLTNVTRYYNFLSTQQTFAQVAAKFPAAAKAKDVKKGPSDSNFKKDEGKFVELPGAEMGKVVVRFPPEASGYLHVGHAKAALLNQHYRNVFQGTLIMRFDDTNPAKETAEFEQVILEDIALLGIKYDKFSHTSDHFDTLLKYAEVMIKSGKAYVDDTDPETMKKEREERVESKNRSNSVEKNLKMWAEMKQGSKVGQTCCVRAKMNMASDNGCMRDPTIYRCKNEPHLRTGNKYRVYPTYDFACPIVDSVEDVTHALRTTEYHDRDDQYMWFLDALGMRKPHIYEFSRLNLQNTVMSKRKLTWFVNEGLVDGWDDPRFPTVRGVLRRGMSVEGLRQFIITQGSSRSVNMMEWDKIWAYNKKVIDPVVPRFTALLKDDVVTVNVAGAKLELKQMAKHPKNADVGTKGVWYGPKILIDGADANTIAEGEIVTFINWGNLKISKIHKNQQGQVTSLDAVLNLDNTDYKKTQKLTWLAEAEEGPLVPTVCVTYDHIITKPVLAKEEDFKNYINKDSKQEEIMLGDPCLADLKKGDVIQLQRRGYFICDQPYLPVSVHTGRASPVVLIYIPDGHQKEMPKAGSKHKESKDISAKEAAQTKKGKSAEKSPQEESNLSAPGVKDLHNKLVELGEKIRTMKAAKPPAPKAEVEVQVKELLAKKAEFKSLTGKVWTADIFKSAEASKPAAQKAAPGSAGGDSNKAAELNKSLDAQALKVRKLKEAKAAKPEIEAAVKTLLNLKTEFKSATGLDWKQGIVLPNAAQDSNQAPAAQSPQVEELDKKVAAQGLAVRQLKESGADKAKIGAEVKVLLALKAEFKAAAGYDWQQGGGAKPEAKSGGASKSGGNANTGAGADLAKRLGEIDAALTELRNAGGDKKKINSEEKNFNKLKKEYKQATGVDWKPSCAAPSQAAAPSAMSGKADSAEALALKAKVDAQGENVRQLKTSGAEKPAVEAAVKELLSLKAQYKELTGEDLAGGKPKGGKKEDKKGGKKDSKNAGGGGNAKKENKGDAKGASGEGGDGKREVKKVTRLGLEATKEGDFSEWYSQVITKSEMIEYYDVSGCYILRPWAYAIWDIIKEQFDTAIKKMGVENCYFPMFVSNSALEKEKTHIEDFAPEVAWVTKSGKTDLAEPIAIRPTSETVMYPSYAKWIKSHRDLPLRLNQWCNVVRWEFKHPQPFLRTREFLWQEGHTAWADKPSAEGEVFDILEEYARVYEYLLAIPVVRGKKTTKEKFAGADFTTTVEAYISASGRAIQGATSHHLGQNFSKMFEIMFDDPESQEKQFVYQNSWGITTRTIGVLAMVHGDNAGLVLPPRAATLQAVVVPCGVTASMSEADANQLYDRCTSLSKELVEAGIRCRADVRDNYSPGWKFNHWELKGVPVRLELGPRDLKQNQVVAVRRDTGSKSTLSLSGLADSLKKLHEEIQAALYAKAEKDLGEHLIVSESWEEFLSNLDKNNLIQAPFCDSPACEDKIKKDSTRVAEESGALSAGAKGLCIPFKQPREIAANTKCIMPGCCNKPKCYTMFGRSY